MQLVEIEVNALIEELLIPLRLMPEAQARLIEFIPLPLSVYILGDRDKLKQVFINLIRNACEAVDAGETIRWTVAHLSLEQVCISIHNRGIEIPANVLTQLTKPFYSTKAEGTGLGLAIVQRIVEAHSGELIIESSQKEGTVFSVFLPIQPPYHNEAPIQI